MAGVRPEKLTVSKIKSRLLNVAQTSLYRLTLPVPQAVRNTLSLNSVDYDNISLLCSEAALPGSTLTTHEVNNDYHGVTEKMAYRKIYDDRLDFTFMVDKDYNVIQFFEGWINYITGQGTTFTNDEYVSRSRYYRMNYPRNYKTDNLYISKFEKDVKDF